MMNSLLLNMDKKKFLKPDWRRIILTILLWLLTFVAHLTPRPLPTYEQSLLNKILTFPYLSCYQFPAKTLVAILCWLLSPIIIWYLIACILFYSYDTLRAKFRGKNK